MQTLLLVAMGMVAPAFIDPFEVTGTSELKRLLTDQNNVHGIFVQRRASVDGTQKYTIKLEIAKSYGTQFTILQPISSQGVASIDDGKTLRNYFPDKKQIVVQPSPVIFGAPLNERMKLIQKNYSVTLSAPTTVAGRPVSVVTMTAKAPQIPNRRLSIDAKENALLRYELLEGNTVSLVLVETLAVDYPSTPRRKPFEFSAAKAVNIVRTWGPKPITDIKFAAAAVGFEPRLTKSLPYGFTVQAQQMVGEAKDPFVSIRLSDGMSMATVYQWDPKRYEQGAPAGMKAQFKDRFGIAFQAIGDAPSMALTELARVFSRLR